MNVSQRTMLVLLRILIGWVFFYAGITKVTDAGWSAAGYLKGAHTFPGFYAWLASPGVLPVTNFLNEWGLTLVGLALMLGLFTRLASLLGAVIMLLYYFPGLTFPHLDHSFLVDEHIIYGTALLALWASRAGRLWGLDKRAMTMLPERFHWLG